MTACIIGPRPPYWLRPFFTLTPCRGGAYYRWRFPVGDEWACRILWRHGRRDMTGADGPAPFWESDK
jgi:hypothetical protein